ncbi:ATP synthase E chain-domain-containing protein [Usnea florida]
MASSGVNVLRYVALFTGVGYGFYHQASLTAKTKTAHVDREFENQASLIAKAKAEWVKKTMPKDAKEGAGEFVVS